MSSSHFTITQTSNTQCIQRVQPLITCILLVFLAYIYTTLCNDNGTENAAVKTGQDIK